MKVKRRSAKRPLSVRKVQFSGKVRRTCRSKQGKRAPASSSKRKPRKDQHRGSLISPKQSDACIQIGNTSSSYPRNIKNMRSVDSSQQDCVTSILTSKVKKHLKASFNRHRRLIEAADKDDAVSELHLLRRSTRIRSISMSNQEQVNVPQQDNVTQSQTIQNSECDCVLIEETQEIIVIDDDGDDDKDLFKDQSNKLEKPLLETCVPMEYCTINDNTITDPKNLSVSSLESGELNSTGDIEGTLVENGTVKKKEESHKIESEGDQEEKEEHENKTGLSMFYEDVTASFTMQDETPLYETIDSDDSVLLQNQNMSTDDVVFVSATTSKRGRSKRESRRRENSVIFVCEELLPPIQFVNKNNLEYIPLEKSNNNNKHVDAPSKYSKKSDRFLERRIQPSRKLKENLGLTKYLLNTETPSPPKTSRNDIEFTTTERKRNAIYNSNTYNPNKEVKKPGKRMIIIDGSNIAYAHSCNKGFSVKGIQIALQYFEKMGHEVKAVVPQYRLQKARSTDPTLLETLHRDGKIVFTPCKNLPGKSTSCYDDRFILQLAVEFDACVVSNDNYRDLLTENPAFKKVIESRVIGYTWCNDMFMLPKDPYGRNGPNLSVIMNRT